ncbi:MAG: hypothetical protein ACPGXL_05225 [Chitinophagales bacterium]
MLRNVFFVSLMLICGIAFGQAAAQVGSINKYNESINEAIGQGKLYRHQVVLNHSGFGKGKIWGNLSKYQETLDYYFEVLDGNVILRKLIIVSDVAARKSYSDLLFNTNGELALAYDDYDMMSTGDNPKRYHFIEKRLVQIEKEGFATDQTNDEDAVEAVEVLNRAANYKKVFDNLANIARDL